MKKCNYSYMIVPIGEDGEEAYKAVIPKFPDLLVMADTVDEINSLVPETIEEAIEYRKKEGRPIPPPDKNTKFSGKILLRVDPSLHEELYHQSQAQNISLNKLIAERLKTSHN